MVGRGPSWLPFERGGSHGPLSFPPGFQKKTVSALETNEPDRVYSNNINEVGRQGTRVYRDTSI